MGNTNHGKLKGVLFLGLYDFLFLSNGYGEDAIASKIAETAQNQRSSAAFPLIGRGKSYEKRGVPVIHSFPELPSAGVSFYQDFKSGLIRRIKDQWTALEKIGKEARFIIAVGDIFPVFLSQYSARRPTIFIGTAKSHYVQDYNFLERSLLKRNLKNFVRDKITADVLNQKDTAADFVGNPMMDETLAVTWNFPDFDGLTLALLPGSRSDCAENFSIQVDALQLLQQTKRVKIRGIAHLPPSLDPKILTSKLIGWDGVSTNEAPFLLGAYTQGEVLLLLAQNSLGETLKASSLVLGQAGTGNEQAAGAGKPVVAFDWSFSRNGKLSWYRWRQKKLLGDALAVVRADSKHLAEKTYHILGDRDLYQKMSYEGKNRMGPAGGSQKIVEYLKTL